MLSKGKYFSIEPASPKESRNTILILLAILVTGFMNVYFVPLKYFFNNVAGIESVNGCPLLTLTGVPCPLCGVGRIFSGLMHFQFAGVFYYNPLGLVFLIMSGFVFSVILILSLGKKKIVLTKPAQKLWYIPVLFIILMWVLNILYGHHH
jgi:hypothetical protein